MRSHLDKGKRFASKASGPLAQGIIPTLDVAGRARAFVTEAVGASGKGFVPGRKFEARTRTLHELSSVGEAPYFYEELETPVRNVRG